MVLLARYELVPALLAAGLVAIVSFAGQLGSVLGALVVGTGVYLLACRALKVRELGALLALLRRLKTRLT